jgi:hypothetical protein
MARLHASSPNGRSAASCPRRCWRAGAGPPPADGEGCSSASPSPARASSSSLPGAQPRRPNGAAPEAASTGGTRRRRPTSHGRLADVGSFPVTYDRRVTGSATGHPTGARGALCAAGRGVPVSLSLSASAVMLASTHTGVATVADECPATTDRRDVPDDRPARRGRCRPAHHAGAAPATTRSSRCRQVRHAGALNPFIGWWRRRLLPHVRARRRSSRRSRLCPTVSARA